MRIVQPAPAAPVGVRNLAQHGVKVEARDEAQDCGRPGLGPPVPVHGNRSTGPSSLGQVACDAGYASKRNLHEANAHGVTDMVFERKRGLQPAEMASTLGVYDKLRRFRAGIEAAISYLKRCFGLRRCHWRGPDHFRAYVWSAIVAHNLAVLARQPVETEADVSGGATSDGSPSRPTRASPGGLAASIAWEGPAKQRPAPPNTSPAPRKST